LDLVSVDKMLLYSLRIQTTCASKHYEPSQDSYLTAMLAGELSFKQADKMNHEACVNRHSRNKSIIINQINKNHSKVLKLLHFEKF